MAVAVSLVSSLLEKPLPDKTIFIGEIGLSGEIKPVREIALRLKEAEKKGFKRAFVPERLNLPKHNLSLEIIPCRKLLEVCEKIF
jgi:DNA repair protein RadA/Sms